MTAVEAYDLAVARWGSVAGVWSPGPGRCVVGVWMPGAGNPVLTSRTQGFGVLGEGTTWEAALAAAGVK